MIQIHIATTLNSKKINPVEMQKLGEFRHRQETPLSNFLEIDLHCETEKSSNQLTNVPTFRTNHFK